MRVERLVIEAGGNTFTVDLHRKLTVVAGMGTVERESLTGELIGSLVGGRPGVHLELEDGKGRHLAVFRPTGGRPRVVDVDTVQDVSQEFRAADGRLDLLAPLGVDGRAARRLLRLTAADLATTTDGDAAVEQLSALDQAELWSAADRLRAAEDALVREAEATGSAPEDAEIIDRIERRHADLERALERHENMRRWTVLGGGISAIGSVPAALVAGPLAAPVLIVALAMGALSASYRLRITQAERAEERALAEAGAQSYLGFHLQRVDGLLADDAHRKRLVRAAEERREAATHWERLAGEVPLDWALEHRDRILAGAAITSGVLALDRLAAETPALSRDRTTDITHALVSRIAEVRSVGGRSECLPLVLDDPFRTVDPSMKPLLLELLSTAAGTQIVYLTEDEDVASWARLEALTGELSIIEPAPQPHDVTAPPDVRRRTTV